jgi:hypothetical protein
MPLAGEREDEFKFLDHVVGLRGGGPYLRKKMRQAP